MRAGHGFAPERSNSGTIDASGIEEGRLRDYNKPAGHEFAPQRSTSGRVDANVLDKVFQRLYIPL